MMPRRISGRSDATKANIETSRSRKEQLSNPHITRGDETHGKKRASSERMKAAVDAEEEIVGRLLTLCFDE